MIAHLDTDRATVIEADCVEVLKTLPDCSIDAVVTDPPYELGFMGRAWDATGIAYSVDLWREVLRVLKPGGHLLAFGGTRTYHRMACAIEDAGFEIRDSLHYMYGTGFPKSLNVSQAIRGKGIACECDRDVRGVRQGLSNVEGLAKEGQDPGLFPAVQRTVSRGGLESARAQGQSRVDGSEPTELSGENDRAGKPSVEGRGNLLSEKGELQGDQVREVSGRVYADGSEGRIRNGTQADPGAAGGATPDARRGSAPRRSRSAKQQPGQLGAVADQPVPQISGAWERCNGCGKPVVPEGIGTALKPGHEPIVMARKPLVGTVAANVLAHGTGGLNIDGCRIEGAKPDTTRGAGGQHASLSPIAAQGRIVDDGRGRWPANVLLDPDAAAELDAQSGDRPVSGTAKSGKRHTQTSMGFHGGAAGSSTALPADSGGASRFFYVAKPSRRERDLGCEGLAPKTGGEATDREEGTEGLENPRAGAGRTGGARNFHPTVKPIALLRHLVRLVTPPGGVVLDPFLGSGTTGIAAALEGFAFLGIEKSPEYIPIALARLTAANEVKNG